MEDVKISINPQGFPSQFVSDKVKESLEFGLQIGQAIQYEWFRKDGGQSRFYNQWADFHRLRLYARGEQSIQKYKNELAIDGDLSYLNLDWTPVPIIPKFVDIVVNGMAERLFKINCYAQDAMSLDRRSQYQVEMRQNMQAKPLMQQFQKDFNINPFPIPEDEIPNTSEELSLHMQLKYKPAIEIAEEEALNTVLSENRYQDIQKQLYYDQMVLGISMCKHRFLPNAGISIEYVDPANVVYSYTEDPNFKDCFYWGEIKTLPIIELKKIDPSLTNADMDEISKYSQSWYDYNNTAQYYNNSMFSRDSATCLFFNYKTTNTFTYKKKENNLGAEKVIEKDQDFDPTPEMQQEGKFVKVTKTIDVWYEGVMVMGTNILLKWQMAENMARPQSASQEVYPEFIAAAPRMYKGVVESLVRRMITFADLIQVTHLKLQQVIARTVPDGIFIDADGLSEVDLGTGQTYNPEDAIRMFFQTGSVIGRSYTQDGDFNQSRVPIQQLNSNSGQAKIQSLVATYNHYMSMLRDVTGLNEARDGTRPDTYALVGLQKLAALSSNTATRHILDAGLTLTERLCTALSSRIADLLEYSEFRDEFINQVGKFNVGILEEVANLYLSDFGIFIEVLPDEEEKKVLEANVQMALSKNDINLEDAIDVREIRNIKLANQVLKLKRKQKLEQDQQAKAAAAQQQAQINMQSQQMAAQTAMQKLQMETQAAMQIEQAKATYSVEKMKGEAAIKSELMKLEFDLQMQIQNAQQKGLKEREDQREKAKSERISQANTEQSKLIEQRKNNLPPVSFESNEDSLDGFDLAEFEPR
ncbi:MAG: putative structural protein [Prokaryotic dsDNA virus sp.]|jgi:hypothetical protein|nr:MAG: putative structural protein [Prokaryotic dsDNA virus sp.]|tara:strand:+ start:209 stop:2644 length:2436 start_codon:yes stop_codon:yes gene_type:complete